VSRWIVHPYPYTVFAWIVGFILVFRANNAYSRYWEATTNFHAFQAKLANGAMQILTYDFDGQLSYNLSSRKDHAAFANRALHAVSLAGALACQSLRQDWDLLNLTRHETLGGRPPPLDTVSLQEDEGSSTHSGPSTPRRRNLFRPGHWRFRVPDVFMLRSHDVDQAVLNYGTKLPVLGGLLPEEARLLGIGAASGNLARSSYDSNASERVAVALTWVQRVVTQRIARGGMQVAPPIQTRVHQVVGDALEAYEQCRKVASTPFPFPTAQLVLLLLVLFAVSMPVLVAALITETWVGAVFCYFATTTYWALNEIARDIEDPFLYDPNHLPLSWLQYKLNERLLQVLRALREPIPSSELDGAVQCTLIDEGRTQAFNVAPDEGLVQKVVRRRPKLAKAGTVGAGEGGSAGERGGAGERGSGGGRGRGEPAPAPTLTLPSSRRSAGAASGPGDSVRVGDVSVGVLGEDEVP